MWKSTTRNQQASNCHVETQSLTHTHERTHARSWRVVNGADTSGLSMYSCTSLDRPAAEPTCSVDNHGRCAANADSLACIIQTMWQHWRAARAWANVSDHLSEKPGGQEIWQLPGTNASGPGEKSVNCQEKVWSGKLLSANFRLVASG